MSGYIDRDKLIADIKHLCWVNKSCEYDAIQCVKKQPTADVQEVRHGEWTTLKRGRRLYCSRCEYPKPYKKLKTGYHIIDEGKYCPNCGAKMDGERREENGI